MFESAAIAKHNQLKNIKKCQQKQKRAHHRLLRDMNIKCCDFPTQYLMICNAGLTTGLRREMLQEIINPLVQQYELILPLGKSYCFINFYSKEDCIHVYKNIHGKVHLREQNATLCASFSESVPDVDDNAYGTGSFPPGLYLLDNFITEEEEKFLSETINWDEKESVCADLKHRKVKHFGYEFKYGINKVNPDEPITPVPGHYQFLQTLFEKHGCGMYQYDQLTINHYLPGQGIPAHIDTHSCFENTILSLSLGSTCSIDFRKENQKISVFLPPRSLLIMSGEARYAWSHGICPRHNDVIKTTNGVTIKPRDTRTSFTFRKVRKGACQCKFVEYCDTKDHHSSTLMDEKTAIGLERSYVHKVYEEISNHFNETRHKQWPNVVKFLESLDKGNLLVDVGCGNGKYLQGNQDVFKIGCDRSNGLTEICRKRGFEVLLSDCLYLPYKDNCLDAAISIAVIHHLSTQERRKKAISEITRVLKPGGKGLIYVWAKEQNKDSVQSTYLKYNTNKKEKPDEMESTHKMTEHGVMFPIHENRTEFTHSDMLVPWKRKEGGNFLRYYHVFEENELPKLCSQISSILIENVYYDQGNWCIILQKKAN